jgi:hypothetical protein
MSSKKISMLHQEQGLGKKVKVRIPTLSKSECLSWVKQIDASEPWSTHEALGKEQRLLQSTHSTRLQQFLLLETKDH